MNLVVAVNRIHLLNLRRRKQNGKRLVQELKNFTVGLV